MDVGSSEIIITFFQQQLGHFLCPPSIQAGKREQIQLEENPHGREAGIVISRHVDVPFRVGYNRVHTFGLYGLECVIESVRRREIGGLHQKMIVSLPHCQQIPCRETLLEEVRFASTVARDILKAGGLRLRSTKKGFGLGARILAVPDRGPEEA